MVALVDIHKGFCLDRETGQRREASVKDSGEQCWKKRGPRTKEVTMSNKGIVLLTHCTNSFIVCRSRQFTFWHAVDQEAVMRPDHGLLTRRRSSDRCMERAIAQKICYECSEGKSRNMKNREGTIKQECGNGIRGSCNTRMVNTSTREASWAGLKFATSQFRRSTGTPKSPAVTLRRMAKNWVYWTTSTATALLLVAR